MFRLCYLLCALIFTLKFNQIDCQCNSDQCPKSVFDPNLAVSPDKECYDIGDSVTLTCSGVIGGPEFNSCKNPPSPPFNGWELPPGTTCEVFTCGKPNSTDANLNFTPDKTTYNARETVTYSCNQGYILIGSSSSVCDAEDTWNPASTPVCAAVCEVPTIANGQLSTSGPFYEGSTTSVECDDGYELESGSSSSITCQNDGEWDNVPQCFRSCDVPDVSNGEISTSGPFVHGQTAEVRCDEGYTMDGTSEFTITCQDGDWDPVPDCYEDCEEPTPPEDGFVTTGNRDGETISYGCNEGFALNGIDSATCTNGTWSSEAPTCYEIISTCETPADVDEELILTPEKTIYNANEVVTYSCPEGKTLKGSEEATCSESGEWQPPDPPVCHGEMIRGTWSSLFILIFTSLLALYSS